MGPTAQSLITTVVSGGGEELEESSLVHTFENLNQALEWCENDLLSLYYKKAEKAQGKAFFTYEKAIPGRGEHIPALLKASAGTPRGQQTDIAASMIVKGIVLNSSHARKNIQHPKCHSLPTLYLRSFKPFLTTKTRSLFLIFVDLYSRRSHFHAVKFCGNQTKKRQNYLY